MKTLLWGKKNPRGTECLFFRKLKILERAGLQKSMHTQQYFAVKSHNLLLETAVLL